MSTCLLETFLYRGRNITCTCVVGHWLVRRTSFEGKGALAATELALALALALGRGKAESQLGLEIGTTLTVRSSTAPPKLGD